MMQLKFGVEDTSVSPVFNADYYSTLKRLIRGAKVRCLASLFIIDPLPRRDRENRVHSLLLELQDAMWRGVETRVLIGGSRTNLDIAEISQLALDICLELGIDARWLTKTDQRGSHVKMVIIDDLVVVGSHNWSSGALTKQIQDSVIIHSSALAEELSTTFERQWNREEA